MAGLNLSVVHLFFMLQKAFIACCGCLLLRMYYKAFNIGDINGAYPAPFGLLYRSIAVLGTEVSLA